MYPKIINVKAVEDYSLYLLFDNKEIRVFSLKPFLDFGIFSELVDENMFKKVKISFDTIEWENGADLDPEFLYSKSKTAKNIDNSIFNVK